VDGDANWGKAHVEESVPCYGSVVDTGDASEKKFTVIRDKYGTGSGNVTIYIRGDTSSFAQHDVSPEWAVYNAPIVRTWQYVQLKMVYTS